MTTPQLDLVALLDVDEADAWGANCGPAALAGAFGLQLADVREAVSDGPAFRGYMTITHMRAAIDRLAPPRREAIVRTFFEGVPTRQQGIPFGTVVVRISRAKAELAASMR